MSDWKLPWNGACLCGQVKVRVTEAPVVAAACHCRACQKLTGGAYSLSLMLPASGLSVEGETVTDAGRKVVSGQTVRLNSEASASLAEGVTLILNKPVGYVSGQPEPGKIPAVRLLTAAGKPA